MIGFGRIRNFFNNIGWFIQRGRRGWADCDVWWLNTHLAGIIVGALTRQRRYGRSYPGCVGARTEEEWDDILDRMMRGFAKVADDYDEAFESPEYKDAMELFAEWFPALWD